MFVTVVACIVATYMGLMQPTKPGRLQSAVINRSAVAGVILGVAYIGMTWVERKTREAVARAALAAADEFVEERLDFVGGKDFRDFSGREAAALEPLQGLAAGEVHEVFYQRLLRVGRDVLPDAGNIGEGDAGL